MILAQPKALPMPHLSLRRLKIILAVCLLLLGAGLVVHSFRPREEHCVMAAQPEGAPPVNSEMHCFPTQVEALRYATGGRINLPPDASREEIDYALNHQTP